MRGTQCHRDVASDTVCGTECHTTYQDACGGSNGLAAERWKWKGDELSMRTTDPLPPSNSEGMDLMAEYLSDERSKGFRTVGLTMTQGRRAGARIRDLD